MNDVQPSEGFAWTQGPIGRVLRAGRLAPMADAWFTTRDLALGGSAAEAANGWTRLSEAAGIDADHLVRLVQVHGAGVHVHRRGEPRAIERPTADAAITDDPGVALAVQVADCAPVLLVALDGRAAGAIHAGWRGTAVGAVVAAVRALTTEFGVPAAHLVAAIGPSIGPCSYRVGDAVEDAFVRAGHGTAATARWFGRDAAGSLTLDLWSANRDQLVGAGVPRAQIYVAGLCTVCHPALFHSYRRDDAGAGRTAGVVRLGPSRPR